MKKFGVSSTGNPLTVFVNLHQTKEERRNKYWAVRNEGYSPAIATRLRDWRWKSIFQFFDTKKKGGD